MELKGSKTEQNLLKSFAGEAQANLRYTIFAKVARKEGYQQIADFFEENSINEAEHGKLFFKYLQGGQLEITETYPSGKLGSTKDNLIFSAEGEEEESQKLYPEFANIAREEGFIEIAILFDNIAKIEASHAKRFRTLLINLETDYVFKKDVPVLWYCQKCGYIHESIKAPKLCPVCSHERAYFEVKKDNY